MVPSWEAYRRPHAHSSHVFPPAARWDTHRGSTGTVAGDSARTSFAR